MSKITVAEWIAFCNDPWPDGQYTDDTLIEVDGEEIDSGSDMHAPEFSRFPNTATVKIIAGIVYKNDEDSSGKSLKSVFSAWRKSRTTATLIVECPRKMEAAFRSLIEANGGKVK